ncbi:MAG: TonB-dependent receptor [Desulfobacterales bacterium]|nr:TonB-dependent receptor [Desulfobacterales bacterium]
MSNRCNPQTLFHLFFCYVLFLINIGFFPSLSLGENTSTSSTKETLSSLSLKELFDLEIISVHKTKESFLTTPAAMYVITRDDIDRSGAEMLPDLLIHVPGVTVFQSNRHVVASGIRDDTQALYSTSLPLIDGMPVYSIVTGGPEYHQFYATLPEIERIEVIRGSGGSSWGANASTGVMNIITKNAFDSIGTITEATLGNQNRYTGTIRHGFGTEDHAMVITINGETDDGFDGNTAKTLQYERVLCSNRYDGHVGDLNVMARVGYYSLQSDQEHFMTHKINTGNDYRWLFFGHTDYKLNNGDTLTLQPYYVKSKTNEKSWDQDYDAESFGVEGRFHHVWSSDAETQITTNYSRSALEINSKGQISSYDPKKKTLLLKAVGFHHIQPLVKRLKLEIGSRAETYTTIQDEWVYSPAGRISYEIREDLFIWAASAKSYQLPTYIQYGSKAIVGYNTQTKKYSIQRGNTNLNPEESIDYQFGFRYITDIHLFDITLYYKEIEGQIYVDPLYKVETPGAVSTLFNNYIDTKGHGVEFSWKYSPFESYNSTFNFTYFSKEEEVIKNKELYGKVAPTYAPKYKVSWINQANFPWRTKIFGNLTWVDDYVSENTNGIFADPIYMDSHFRFDVTIQHVFLKNHLTVSLSAKNIFNNDYEWKYTSLTPNPLEVEPSIYLNVKYEF